MKSNRLFRKCAGFTLIELIVTIILMAILAGVAAPSVKQFMVDQAVKAVAVDLVGALNYTRSEAVKRNASVTLVPVDAWNDSWELVIDTDTLRVWEVSEGLSISGPDEIEFFGNGRLAAAVEFVICNASSEVRIERRIVRVDSGGRANLARGARCGA